MKNLRDQSTLNELLARIDKLTPEAKALWGKMNVNQSLRHMTYGLQVSDGGIKIAPVKSPLPKFIMKFFLLNFKPPKGGAETFKEINTVANGINPTDFEAERKALKEELEKVAKELQLLPKNPMGISFSESDWGCLGYNHTDHHLRQFGV